MQLIALQSADAILVKSQYFIFSIPYLLQTLVNLVSLAAQFVEGFAHRVLQRRLHFLKHGFGESELFRAASGHFLEPFGRLEDFFVRAVVSALKRLQLGCLHSWCATKLVGLNKFNISQA